jgi:predicted metal-dependent peptidase
MKTTRIEIEGAKGKAAIRRETDEVVIEATVGRKTTTWRFFSRIHEDQVAMARRLQQRLDGYRGTAGDVADYLRAIQNFAD